MDRKIQMVDLKGQYLRIKNEIDFALVSAASEAAYINGPQVQFFTESLKKYNQVEHVIPCANGTDALQIAMMGLGFKRGDEIIVPAFTYIATVEVIALLGLVPRFIDVNENTFELDHTHIEKIITDKTVGIVPVHLFGQCSNMDAILEISKKYELAVIEDTAQAMGAEYIFKDGSRKFAGTIGDVGITSFFPSKNLGCFGDGGAIFTRNERLAEGIRTIANHGQKKKYYHETIGVNSRLDTLQAAILDIKIKYLEEYIVSRRRVAEKYDRAFANHAEIIIPQRASYSTHVYNQYTCRINNNQRDGLKQYLEDKCIPTMIYYPVPIHLQEAYLTYGYGSGDFPVAEKLCRDVISFPIHTEMNDETQNYIIDNILSYFNS